MLTSVKVYVYIRVIYMYAASAPTLDPPLSIITMYIVVNLNLK